MLLIIVLLLIIIILLRLLPINEPFVSSKNLNIEHTYLINLDKDIGRMSIIDPMLKREKVKYERFPAVYGKNVDMNSEKCNRYFSNKGKKILKPAQIGCSLSHISIWEKIAEKTENPNAVFMILEDDAILPQMFQKKLSIFSEELPDNWEMLLLGTNSMIGKVYSKHLLYNHKSIKKNGNYGTYAYLIKQSTAKKLLKTCEKMNTTIDHYLNKNFYLKNRVYFCNPQLVSHNYDLMSNIVNRTRNEDKERGEKIRIVR
jgi:glycosyl transferase family 25